MSDILIPTLETDRLMLRGHTTQDIEASAAMWADPEVVRLISGQPSTEAQSWSRVLTYAGLWHHLGYGYWAVFDKSTGVFRGEVGFADFKRGIDEGGAPEIGWAFRTDAQGQGYAIEAVNRILEWADESLDSAETFCIFDPAHSRSLKLAEKVGYSFRSEGQKDNKKVLVMSRAMVRQASMDS